MRVRVALIIAVTLLGACNQNNGFSGSYVGGDSTALIQLNIVEGQNSQVSGGLAVSVLDYENHKVKTKSIGVTGIRSGANFSLLPTNNRSGAIYLEASGSSLILKLPQSGQSIELSPTTQPEYQQRLSDFYESMNANDVGLIPEE